MIDMTKGRVDSILLRFSLPLIGCMVFQQMYNMADSIIVGRYVGENALAAVGVSYPILMIFMAVAVGINIGASVVISQYYGARDYRRVKTASSTAVISITVIALILTFLGLIFLREIMNSLNTPKELLEEGTAYLRISIYGLIFLFIYNIATGIFAALGDSRTPLYFLIASSISNVILDIYFVGSLNLGVKGAAYATFICQGIASFLALITIWSKVAKLKSEKAVYYSFPMAFRISKVAFPSILQQSFISIGNILIQSLVNSFGAAVIAAYSAVIKLNTFSVMTLTTVANGVSSFSAQNKGAGNIERIKEGHKSAIKLGVLFAATFAIIYGIFTESSIKLFLPKNNYSMDVLEEGKRFLRLISPFYFVIVFKLVTDGVMRGCADMRSFMISTFSDLILRVALSYILSLILSLGSMGIWMSWPIGWIVGTVVSIYFYKKGRWKINRLIY